MIAEDLYFHLRDRAQLEALRRASLAPSPRADETRDAGAPVLPLAGAPLFPRDGTP